MTEGVHGYTGLDATTGILVVTSLCILCEWVLRCCVIGMRKDVGLSDILGLAHLCILDEPVLHCIRRETHGCFVHIDKHRMCTNVRKSIASCDEGECLSEHFIITLNACQHQRHVESISTRYAHYSLLGTGVLCHLLLKAIYELAYR